MTQSISSAASNRREQARQTDGKFGHQHHSEADITLGHDDLAEQRRRLEFFVHDQDDQWHQDFINHDVPELRELARYGWETNDPYDLVNLNDRFKTIDLHLFYDDQADPYDAVHDNSGLTPQLWMSDKDGQNWAKVSDQELLRGMDDSKLLAALLVRPEDEYSVNASPESFFSPDEGTRYQPELNKYDYYGGDYDFVHVIPPAGMESITTAYDDPKSPLNQAHPPGESETELLPPLGPGELGDADTVVANAMHAKGITTFVEYGTRNPFEDLNSEHYDPHANQSIVHFYRTDDAGNERHFATGHTKGRLANPNVYGAQVMRSTLAEINGVENSYVRNGLEDWADNYGMEFDACDMSDPTYRRAAQDYETLDQQRQKLIDFFGDESLVDHLAEES